MATIFPPVLKFDSKYSQKDKQLIQIAYNAIRAEARNKMKALVTEDKIIEVSNNIPTEFTTDKNHQILGGKALGIATKAKNWNYMPAPVDLTTLTLYSSIVAMEKYHTIFGRLIPTGYEWIDVIHWLYNHNKLYTIKFKLKHHWYSMNGATYKIVVPDVVYGWKNREEIMAGIKSGKYKEGLDKYSSDPAFAGKEIPTYVPATQHELDMIRNYLVFGTTHPPHH